MRTKGVTMQDIAKAAGVSQSAVSMILNRKSNSFPAATVERVMTAAAELNYRFRRSTSSPPSSTVLVLTIQMTNPYYANMLHGIDRAAIPQALNIVTSCTYHNPAVEASLLQMAIAEHFLGVIFSYPPDNLEAFSKALPRIPIVTVCDKSSRTPGDTVELNNFEAGALAAKHLLSLGHTNIAVLTHASDRSTTSRATRVAGILSEVRKVVSEDHLLVLTGSSASTGILDQKSFYYHVGYSLAQNKRLYENDITGLICLNDLMAYGVMDALIEKGYQIPGDFSLVGSDNLLFSMLSRISLTSIDLYTDTVAQSALSTLLSRVRMTYDNQPNSARFQVQCQPNLVVRNSTGPIRTLPISTEKAQDLGADGL